MSIIRTGKKPVSLCNSLQVLGGTLNLGVDATSMFAGKKHCKQEGRGIKS